MQKAWRAPSWGAGEEEELRGSQQSAFPGPPPAQQRIRDEPRAMGKALCCLCLEPCPVTPGPF